MLFQELVGQERVKLQLAGAVQSGRVPHALIFHGPAGVGKLPAALAFAQYLNCSDPTDTDSCGTCPNCLAYQRLEHPDLFFVAPIFSKVTAGKAATSDDFFQIFRSGFREKPYYSLNDWVTALEAEKKQLLIPIHEIRALKKKVGYKPFIARRKTIIVWHAEKMNTEAANAFLKLLEEPPAETHIILTVESLSQVLPTILSRCQRVGFERISRTDILDHLLNHHGLAHPIAQNAALLSDGSLTAALEVANQATDSFTRLFIDWMRTCYEGLMAKILPFADSLANQTLEYQKLYLEYALKKLRDGLLCGANLPELALASDEELVFLKRFGAYLTLSVLVDMRDLLEQALHHISRNANANMVYVVLSIRMNHLLRGQPAR